MFHRAPQIQRAIAQTCRGLEIFVFGRLWLLLLGSPLPCVSRLVLWVTTAGIATTITPCVSRFCQSLASPPLRRPPFLRHSEGEELDRRIHNIRIKAESMDSSPRKGVQNDVGWVHPTHPTKHVMLNLIQHPYGSRLGVRDDEKRYSGRREENPPQPRRF